MSLPPDPAFDQWLATMEAMNRQYIEAGAVVTDENGHTWVTQQVMPDEFDAMYSALTSVGMAKGWC